MITGLDHIVLTVRDVDAAAAVFARVLGMVPVTFAGNRRAVTFGSQKINLQSLGQETRNRAVIGSGDLCLLSDWPMDRITDHLAAEGIPILEGPVVKTGATGPILSVYFHDLDENLIEVSVPAD